MAQAKGLRDLSKDSYQLEPTIESINCGSLQRIADATEVMAKNYLQLQSDLTFYKKRTEELLKRVGSRDNTIKSLKGHITRLKKQVQSTTQNPQ